MIYIQKFILVGLVAGLLIGSVATYVATRAGATTQTATSNEMSMDAMTTSLQSKSGAEFDRAFLEMMIEHHQGAIDMARLSADRAEHDEVKALSQTIISAQEREIADMRQWLSEWGLSGTDSAPSDPMAGMDHSMP